MHERIRKLLQDRRAVLLAHNYQPPEIQQVADICGDSLELSIQAARTAAEVIVFCGVRFMAETASILSPRKTVLLPRPDAGCPMADMITPARLARRQAELPVMPVVTYVNSPAAVKACSTICCTSANATAVVASLKAAAVLMAPDRNLARNTAARTATTVHLFDGFCPIHDRLDAEQVRAVRRRHPAALLMVHPECRPEVAALADTVVSTSGMIRFARQQTAREFIYATEVGMAYPLQRANPGKRFYPASEEMVCADMKKIGLADVARCLEQMSGAVRVPEEIRVPALAAVRRMLDVSA